MLDKLVEFLIDIIELFKFWEVLDPYEQGVRLRLGKWNQKILGCGFHWKIPFQVDVILTLTVVPSVKELSAQTITTLDGVSIGVQAIVKYEIKNVATALLEVDNEIEAVAELTQGIIRSVLMSINFSEVNKKDVEETIKQLAKKEAEKWGIKVVAVTIKSLGKMPTIRLMQ